MASDHLSFVFTFFKDHLPSTVTGKGLVSTVAALESAIATQSEINEADKHILCENCIHAAEDIPERTYSKRQDVIEEFVNSPYFKP